MRNIKIILRHVFIYFTKKRGRVGDRFFQHVYTVVRNLVTTFLERQTKETDRDRDIETET